MAADDPSRVEFLDELGEPEQQDNEIWYTTTDGQIMEQVYVLNGPTLESNTYENGKGILKFSDNVTSIGMNTIIIGDGGLWETFTNLKTITFPNSVETFDVYGLMLHPYLTDIYIKDNGKFTFTDFEGIHAPFLLNPVILNEGTYSPHNLHIGNTTYTFVEDQSKRRESEGHVYVWESVDAYHYVNNEKKNVTVINQYGF